MLIACSSDLNISNSFPIPELKTDLVLHRRITTLLATVLMLVLVNFSAIADVKTSRKPIVFSDYLGVNTPFLFFPEDIQLRQIQRLKELGLKWVRLDLHWYHLEPQEGNYDVAALDVLMKHLQESGIEPVVYLVGSAKFASTAPAGVTNIDQYPPRNNEEFAKRMLLLAQRYPFVRYWQVWNEPNIHPFWQPKEDPVAYARLLQTTVQGFRLYAPDRKMVLGGMAYFSQMAKRGGFMLEELIKLGKLGLVDVVAYHPYTDLPEGDPSVLGLAKFTERAKLVNARLRAAQVKEIWATEFGWSTYKGEKIWQSIIDERTQADYLLRRLALSMEQDFDRVFWFALMDLDERVDVRDRYYGLIARDATPKPSFNALKYFLHLTGGRIEPIESPICDVSTENFCFAWRSAKGKRLVFFWGPKAEFMTLPEAIKVTLHDPLSAQQKAISNAVRSVKVEPRFQILEF